MIHMLSGTHVPQNTLCVTFGARHRSIPLGVLDRTLGYLDPQGHPVTPNGSAWRPFGLPTSPKDALQTLLGHACGFVLTSSPGIYSVGEGAVHMKCPDDIGREAGIGRTRNRNELSVFRACPW